MFEKLTHQYSLSKTLRFELKPINETADYLEDFKSQHLKDFVKQDRQRADNYKIIKELIDDYHRAYIEEKLRSPVNPETGEMWVTPEDFENAFSDYQRLKEDPKDQKNRKTWEDTQTSLRKKLVKSFIGISDLFKKELITRDLPAWLKSNDRWEENREVVESFNKFTTYFSGFHENRKNMYVSEDQSTAISYRLMNENLPRFFNNCLNFKKISQKYHDLDFFVEPDLLKKMEAESITAIFQPRYYINLFAQSGIDNYQLLLGGKTIEEGTKKVQGLNEQLNLFRQQQQKRVSEEAKANNEKPKKIYDLSGFTDLYKQILSDRESTSFIPEAFEDDKDLLNALAEYIRKTTEKNGLRDQLETAIARLSEADPEKVYIKAAGLTAISQSMFHGYRILTNALEYHAEKQITAKKAQKTFLDQKVYSLAELDNTLVAYVKSLEESDPLHEQLTEFSDPDHLVKSYLLDSIQLAEQGQEDRPTLENAIEQVQPLLTLDDLSKKRNAPQNDQETGGEGFQQVQKIQKMLDSFMAISHAVKPLHLVDGRKPIDMPDMDTGFYGEFSKAYDDYTQPTITLYNKARNHLTKKPFSTDKLKITFEKGNFLDGFVESKTDNSYNGTQYGGYLFRKKRTDGAYNYFLGISKKNNLFSFYDSSSSFDGEYERLNYYQMKTTSVYGSSYAGDYSHDKKDFLEKVLSVASKHSELGDVVSSFSKKKEEMKTPTQLLTLIKNKTERLYSLILQDDEVSLAQETIIINIKESLKAYVGKVQSVQELIKQHHVDLKSLQEDIDNLAKRKSFSYKRVSQEKFDEALGSQTMFLFQLYNKDFSEKKKKNPDAKDNLHTMYFKALMSGTQDVYDLGKGEIFFRRHSLKYDSETKAKGHHYEQLKDKFKYPIIKDRRYSVDKFMLHLSVSLNYQCPKANKGTANKINNEINLHLKNTAQDTHIIGIDRGERHLLYYTVINQKGEIKEQGTLNEISTDQGYTVDYQQKLHTKEKEREKARKSWSSVENIKELKAGYLSHVVHKLAGLIIEHNAIVCLEDLNSGFKRGRFKVEKQVYQKFEKALIDKLN